MYNDIITYYAKNPVNKGILENFDVEFSYENRTCGDDLTVYLKIENNNIKDWSFIGETAIITTACASIFGESIIGKDIEEILKFDYYYIENLVGMPISSRRKQASVMGLLSTINAIYQYIGNNKKINFEDIIK